MPGTISFDTDLLGFAVSHNDILYIYHEYSNVDNHSESLYLSTKIEG